MKPMLIPLLAVTAVSTTAHAENEFIRKAGGALGSDLDLSFLAGLGNNSRYQLGARMGFRVANPGFVPTINNSVSIDGGLFLTSNGNRFNGRRYRESHLAIPVYVRWDFHVHRMWTVYAMGGPVLSVYLDDDDEGTHDSPETLRFWPSLGAGALFHFHKDAALRFELDESLTALSLGVTLFL